jgi:membrane protein implicated in regulation of membrane protease activity
MSSFFSDVYVVWLVLGLALCAAETLAPGAFLIWIGAAALGVGVVDYLVPLETTTQLLLFAALVIVLVMIGRQVYGAVERRSAQPPLSRAHGLIGREFFLDQPITHGFGSIRVDDSIWRVAGADLPAGAKVRVTGVGDDLALWVENA